MKSFEKHLIGPDAQLLAAIEAMNRLPAPHIYLIVVDQGRKVLGTLTDGDVRRAILKGIPVTSPLSESMHRNAVLGHLGDVKRNETLMWSLGARPRFLPIVDSKGVLTDILTDDSDLDDRAVAMIMAGGRGSRLGALTENLPKPLVPVGDRPILDHVLERLESAGIRHIYLSVHYLAEKIEAFVQARKSRADIEVVRETEPLGTAGAIGLIAHRVDRDLLVLNGDIITNLDVDSLLNYHERNRNNATIGVTRHDVDIPFGVIRHTEDGRFLSIDEKPRLSNFVSAGVYLLSPEVCAVVPNSRRMDMPDVFNVARDIGLKIGVFPIHEYWIDVGRPSDLDAARKNDSDAPG